MLFLSLDRGDGPALFLKCFPRVDTTLTKIKHPPGSYPGYNFGEVVNKYILPTIPCFILICFLIPLQDSKFRFL